MQPSTTGADARSSTASLAACSCPSSVELAVAETEPGVKGDTVSNVTKPATLETGAVVQVPLFVNVGDRIKVDPAKPATSPARRPGPGRHASRGGPLCF